MASKSKMKLVSAGVPQGSVLGPTLFALHANVLPPSVPSGATYLFADDTTILRLNSLRSTERKTILHFKLPVKAEARIQQNFD